MRTSKSNNICFKLGYVLIFVGNTETTGYYILLYSSINRMHGKIVFINAYVFMTIVIQKNKNRIKCI